MERASARPADELEKIVERYGNSLYRICLVNLQNEADAEDALQDVLLRYIQKSPRFESDEHQKAWLIRVAVNRCRDMLRKRRWDQLDPQQLPAQEAPEEMGWVLEELMKLPEIYRTALTLHYVEEYSVAEIAKIIGATQSAVKMRLVNGRKLLKVALEKE